MDWVARIDAVSDWGGAAELLAAIGREWPVLGDREVPDDVADALLRLLERSDPLTEAGSVEALLDTAPSRDELVWASLRRGPTRTAIDMAGYDYADLDALRDAVERCPAALRAHLDARIADVEDMDDLDDDSDDDDA